MKQWVRLICVILVLSLSSVVSAVTLSNLYQVDVPVSSQADDERVEGIRKGFREVLIRLTGNPNIISQPDIKLAIKRADYFVHDYHYGSPTPDSPILMLHLNFEPRDILWTLQKAGINHWSESRPLVMVWVAVIRPNQTTQVIGDDNPSSWVRDFKAEARKLGLPIILPLMDMSDISQISPTDVTSFDWVTLKEVSSRYAPDAYLIGTINVGDDEFNTRWILQFANKKWESNIRNKNIDNITNTILGQVAQTLSSELDGVSNSAHPIWIKLQIMKVADQHTIDAIIQYLKTINVVQQVQVAQVTNDQAKISVLVSSTLETFAQKASREPRMLLKSQDSRENLLQFDWNDTAKPS